jgi:HAD superfamily hydrolase (TIGR01549 family)
MALLKIGRVSFDADLVAFDKDGTLIDFEFMWGRMAVAWVERLTSDEALRQALYHSLGYDAEKGRTRPQSPLTSTTVGQLETIVAATLYQHGVPWPDAQARARSVFRETAANLPLTDLVCPVGDIAGLMKHLKAAGARVAIITADRRFETEETLLILGIAHLVDLIVCGDDGVPAKPAPDALLATCERLGVAPARTIMVGDTVTDLLMARNAGAGLGVAVLTGTGDQALLGAHADVVLPSIDEIVLEES